MVLQLKHKGQETEPWKGSFSPIVAEFEILNGSNLRKCCSSFGGDTMIETSISRWSDFSAWDPSSTHPFDWRRLCCTEDNSWVPKTTKDLHLVSCSLLDQFSSSPSDIFCTLSEYLYLPQLICWNLISNMMGLGGGVLGGE